MVFPKAFSPCEVPSWKRLDKSTELTEQTPPRPHCTPWIRGYPAHHLVVLFVRFRGSWGDALCETLRHLDIVAQRCTKGLFKTRSLFCNLCHGVLFLVPR